jgi:hypothetical protein
MRSAPPVSVQCMGGVLWRGLQTVLSALAAGAFAHWVLMHLQWPALIHVWLVFDSIFLAAWWAWWQADQAPIHLSFDGAQWLANGAPGAPRVMMDLGPWLLLHWRTQAPRQPRSRWIAVGAAEVGAAMHGLRAALYSTKSRAASPAGGAALGDVGRNV